MKRVVLIVSLMVAFANLSLGQVRVNGYYKKDGTYVEPHYRSNPNKSPYDNYSYPGNTNPYTGETAKGNESTYLDNYYNKSNGSIINSTYTLKDRIVVNDEKGNPVYIFYFSDVGANGVKHFNIYDVRNNFIGKAAAFADGDVWYYDKYGKLLSQ